MNRYANSIIIEFTSVENRDYLRDTLFSHFGSSPTVSKILSLNFDDFVDNFAVHIQQELNLSDPLPGTSIFDQLTSFNNQFIEDRVSFIQAHAVNDNAPIYMVQDNMPTSRHSVKHFQKKPDQILESWRVNSGRGIQAREDPSSDVYAAEYDQDQMSTGVVFCDQSELGMQRHQDLFFGGTYMQALNKTSRPHELTPFGVSTPDADARLLSRNIFRKNECGVENGVMRRDARLHNRNLERDVSEGMRGGERDYINRGHDMTSLYKRIDHKNNIRDKFSRVQPHMHLQLHGINAPREDMRYC